ncbi:hypothetical protein AA650_04505 [Anabaena sp. WA102]|nr:hypothetical protein AA650_04505 [Anabaena sp. WA102]OBQ15111.1 MAG: hypothetical protein AN486_24770 [Anabaena sp. AL93]
MEFRMVTGNFRILTQISRLALKIVVMARQEARVKRIWAILLFVTYFGFFRSPTYYHPSYQLIDRMRLGLCLPHHKYRPFFQTAHSN